MRVRLGDIIDDFCVKCKRVMNHAVVSMVGEEAAKVRCRTCYSDHDYRHEIAPPPKVDPRKLALAEERRAAKAAAATAAEHPVEMTPDEEHPLETGEHPDAPIV